MKDNINLMVLVFGGSVISIFIIFYIASINPVWSIFCTLPLILFIASRPKGESKVMDDFRAAMKKNQEKEGLVERFYDWLFFDFPDKIWYKIVNWHSKIQKKDG